MVGFSFFCLDLAPSGWIQPRSPQGAQLPSADLWGRHHMLYLRRECPLQGRTLRNAEKTIAGPSGCALEIIKKCFGASPKGNPTSAKKQVNKLFKNGRREDSRFLNRIFFRVFANTEKPKGGQQPKAAAPLLVDGRRPLFYIIKNSKGNCV